MNKLKEGKIKCEICNCKQIENEMSVEREKKNNIELYKKNQNQTCM